MEQTHGRDRPGAGEAWLADYRRRVEGIRARAERARSRLEGLTATASSPDGAVTATVGPGGTLTGLAFGPAAEGLSRARLAALVLAAAGEARAEVTAEVAAVTASLAAAAPAAPGARS
ncbi:MAG: YbaB/EbfC family nucleoid-associated protein [Pseudonocardia sp.]|nr:YbaB/EbfC family nucleoid-associated protein [Pseudonocardia sp.]